MILKGILFLFLVGVFSCSHQPHQSPDAELAQISIEKTPVANTIGNKPQGKTISESEQKQYEQQLWSKVGAEIDFAMSSLRKPANSDSALSLLNIDLKKLRSQQPKKFEVYVFPKINSMAMKNNHHHNNDVFLAKPIVVEVSPQAVVECSYLLKQGFKKYNPSRYFPESYKKENKRTCAIVEMTNVTLSRLNKALLKSGDELVKRLYLDDQYNVFGVESEYFLKERNRLNRKTVGMRFENPTHVSAGFGLMPTDMPALSLITQVLPIASGRIFSAEPNLAGATNLEPLVDYIAINQIKRLKKFKVPSCDLNQVTYKDHLLKSVKMYWCKGQAWPQVVDNSQFLAVTQNLNE